VKITVQIVIDAQDGTPPATEQVAAIARDDLTMASAGLALAEAHEVLSGIQHHLAAAQVYHAAIRLVVQQVRGSADGLCNGPGVRWRALHAGGDRR